jgi:hypothetical protein
MDIRRWLMRRIWGRGRSVRYIFIHPTCGHDEVEAGYLPEWGRPKFLCRRCSVVFDEAHVRLEWPNEEAPPASSSPRAGELPPSLPSSPPGELPPSLSSPPAGEAG